jgi:hypothetical protein
MCVKEGFMDTTRPKLIAVRLAGLLCLAVLISACRADPQVVVEPSTTDSEKLFTLTSVSQSINYYTHVSEMIEGADVILIGTAVDTGLRYNGARTQDLIHPDESWYSESLFFQIKVERYLKGHGPEEVFLSMGEWRGVPLPDTRYLFFLLEYPVINDYVEGLPEGAHFLPGYLPWRFEVTEKGELYENDRLITSVPYMMLDQMIAYIQNPASIPPTPTFLPPEPTRTPYPEPYQPPTPPPLVDPYPEP